MFSRYVLIVNDERREAFTAIFGRSRVPIESEVPEQARLPRFGSTAVYKIDLKMLTQQQRQLLEAHLSRVWDMPIEMVEAETAAHGVPIMAEGTTLVEIDSEPDFA